ncbi:MAG: ABC transporter substrate-binding protein [Flavobacteriales bacterium]
MNIFKTIIFIISLTFLSSCVDKRDLSQNTVIAHISSNPDGLHPFNDNSGNRTYVFNYTQQTLVAMDIKKLEIVPQLVKSMPEVSENGLEYTFELKDGIMWDDGSPFTVDDVIFTTKVQLAPLTNNTQVKGNYTSVIESVRKHPSNPNKFIMTAKLLHVSNMEIYSEVYMQQKSYWDPKGILDNYTFDQINDPTYKPSDEMVNWFNEFNSGDNSYKPEKLVGLGPYKITEFVVGSYITLEKKKNWYADGKSDDLPYQNKPDKIIFKIISDDAAAYLAIKNQQLDVSTWLGTTKLLKLQNIDYFNENYYSDFLDQYTYSYMGLNMKPDGIEFKPFFVDQKVRRAMAYLTPIDEIIDVIVQKMAIRQVANVSPLSSSYNHDLPLIEFDIEKGKKLLDEAGWIDTDGDNIRDKVVDGTKLQFSFKLSYMSGSASTKEMVLMIKEAMYKAGIDVIPTPMDFTLFYKNAYDHKFDAMMGAWGGSAGYSDPVQLWHTESWANKGSNFTGFGDAQSDSLLYLANTSLNKEKHIEATKALQKKIYDDQPYVFLYSVKRKIAIHRRFDNANMYNEKPGVALNNLLLKPAYSGSTLKPE